MTAAVRRGSPGSWFLEAELHEATLAGAVMATADGLLATVSRTLQAAALKFVVLFSMPAARPGSGRDCSRLLRNARHVDQ